MSDISEGVSPAITISNKEILSVSSSKPREPNYKIAFSDIHLLVGAVPAMLLPVLAFVASSLKLRNYEDYMSCEYYDY